MRYTISDIAEKFGATDEIVRGLVKFLVYVELAKHMGERKPDTGRGGRAQAVYEFEEGYESKLAKILKAANLTD